jgi:RNA polymerase sigma factor (sigma-70 family)
MPLHPDQRYIEALLQNDTRVIQEIYRQCAATVKRYILQNQGTEEDAADVFQESLIDIYNQAKHKNLQLTCPFEPFLLLVCKRKWLNELKKKGRSPVTNSGDDVYTIGEDVFAAAEQVHNEEAQARLFLQQFERLGKKCKEIIRASLTGDAQEKIAETLGVSYGYLRKKKSECMATLLSYIQGNKS